MTTGSAAILRSDSWIAPLIVLVSALLLFSINLGRPPHPDELHHVLAAQHLAETGVPQIGEGEYHRGIVHTWMVAASYAVFGDSLTSARIPPVVLEALVALVLFVWIRREGGVLAAWLTAALFISSPFTVEIAQFSRFYALQSLCFVFGGLCVYYACSARPLSWPTRGAWGLAALASMAIAADAQVTSLVGMVGMAVWVYGLSIQCVFFNPNLSRTRKIVFGTALIATPILIIAVAVLTGMLELAMLIYRRTQLFNLEVQNDFWFYHVRFLLFYPTLWSLVGLLAVFAVVRNARLAWLAISVFSISFLLMSFAGTKATRYLSFAPPFLAVLWGLGLAQVASRLLEYTRAAKSQLIETIALPPRLKAVAGTSIVAAALAVVVLSNPFWLRTITIIGNVALPGETAATDWPVAREALASWTEDADIMITTEELGAMYYLGRADVRYSPSKLEEIPLDQQFEFGIDHRTGRPLITKPESVERLVTCFPRGFIVGPIEHWGRPILISEEVQAILFRHAKPIEVPKRSYLYAWGWTHEPTVPRPASCAELDRFSHPQKR